jgi:hypothetical protein
MPRIIVQSDSSTLPLAEITLSERIIAANMQSAHYRRQLVERLAWALADAEELEAGLVVQELELQAQELEVQAEELEAGVGPEELRAQLTAIVG